MYSLIASIAQKHGITQKENLASEILSGILDASFSKRALSKCLSESFGLTLPAYFSVSTQQTGEKSRGIPDVWIRDEDDKALLIIECKFYAKFTWYQLNTYIDEIDGKGMLLFLVPKDRSRSAFTSLLNHFRVNYSLCDVLEDDSKSVFSINGKRVAVISWDDMLDGLKTDVANFTTTHRKNQYDCDLEQLRRFCHVAEIEYFDPLSIDQIRGVGISKLIRQLKWLTEAIINRSLEHGSIDQSGGRKNRLSAGHDTSLFFGQQVMFGETPAWVGFWAAAWEDLHDSPVWVCLYKSPKLERLVRYLRTDLGFPVVEHTIEDSTYFFMPVDLKDGDSQEKAVESGSNFLRRLRSAMDDFSRLTSHSSKGGSVAAE